MSEPDPSSAPACSNRSWLLQVTPQTPSSSLLEINEVRAWVARQSFLGMWGPEKLGQASPFCDGVSRSALYSFDPSPPKARNPQGRGDIGSLLLCSTHRPDGNGEKPHDCVTRMKGLSSCSFFFCPIMHEREGMIKGTQPYLGLRNPSVFSWSQASLINHILCIYPFCSRLA